MSVVQEIREEQKKALKNMNTKEKLSYFWEYYKIHTLVVIVVVVFAVSMIHQIVTAKDYGFYASFINTAYADSSIADTWMEEFTDYAQIDTDEYDVYIDTSMAFSGANADPQFALSNQQKLIALVQTGSINVFVADSETFESYAQSEFFDNLGEIFSKEQLEKYQDYLYYTDAAAFEGDDSSYDENSKEKTNAMTVNHKDPDSMSQPIAVGICVTDAAKIKQAAYYSYLSDVTFQGYPSEAVLGIPVTTQNPQLAIQFLDYLTSN